MCSSLPSITEFTPRAIRDLDLEPMKTALFVDFDNIFHALEERAPDMADRNGNKASAARAFATHPERWIAWIERGMPNLKGGAPFEQRQRSLLRRCYLNPSAAGHNRHHFLHAAFSVIDCPFIANGKNSADIHMVIDILDTLDHKTHFDEFIILSGDSDFTPVLLRLRAHNRRTAIMTIGHAAEAYKAAADRVISGDILSTAITLRS